MSWDKSLQVETEGPLGIPMRDEQAKLLDKIIKASPQEDIYTLNRTSTARDPTEVDKDERTDVSWISTEDKDHQKDIVISKGMDQSIYRLNPIVTWNHDYKQPAIGHNLWIKPKKSGEIKGLIAKTHYPLQPDDWHPTTPWMPSQILNLVHLRLLPGKSIGFFPKKARRPTADEISKNPELYKDVRYIVEQWLLLEYSVETMPCQANALVEASKKGLIEDFAFELLGIEKPKEEVEEEKEEPKLEAVVEKDEAITKPSSEPQPPKAQYIISSLDYLKALRQAIDRFDYESFAKQHAKDQVDLFMGRV